MRKLLVCCCLATLPSCAERVIVPLATDRQALNRQLQERGLARVASQLVALVRPRLRLRKITGRPRPRSSHLGGEPELPSLTPWPRWNGRSLAFLVQVRLEDLPAEPDFGLPRRGLLAFFYDQDQTWGFRASDRGSCQVIHSADASACEPRGIPEDLDAHCRYAPVPVELVPELSLPPLVSESVAALALNDVESDALGDLGEPGHWLAGHPEPVQGDDMEVECVMTAAGVDCGGPEAYRDPRMPEWRQKAADWVLLLQLDSDDDAKWTWGDLGSVYFWIRKQELARADFSRVWLVLQCT